LAHRQKKREIQIALNLIDTLKPFMDDEIEEFQAKNSEFAEELSSNNMAKLMLGKIASIYEEQANQQLGGMKSAKANMSEFGQKLSQKKAVAKSMWSTYKAAKKMKKEEDEIQEKEAVEAAQKAANGVQEEEKKRRRGTISKGGRESFGSLGERKGSYESNV